MAEKIDNASIGALGRMRAAESIAAIHCHNMDPDEEAGIILAQGLYMIGAVVSACADEDKEGQMNLVMDRIPDVLEDLKDQFERQQDIADPDDHTNKDSDDDSK